MRTFGERLLTCIADKGTTQAEVARKAGISAASVSEWATDKVQTQNIKAEPLLKAAAFLEVSPTWLLAGRGPRDAKVLTVVAAGESQPRYSGWPFDQLDATLVRKLRPEELLRVEGAWILAAKQLGFSLAKPVAV